MSRKYVKFHISRLMAVLLAVCLLVCSVPAVQAEGESGTCGDNLQWRLSAGTLTITGSGSMYDYPETTFAPWYALREEILRVELPEGLTSIGMLAFYECKNLTAVTIPGSVMRIGSYAFAKCTGLQMLNLGSGVASVEECAFSDCYELQSLRLPGSLQSIGPKAFYRLESIPAVTIPAGVTSIGVSAFAYCKDLVSADIYANIRVVPEWMFYGCEKLVSVTLPDSVDTVSEYAFRGCDNLSTVYYDGTAQTPEEIQESIGEDVPSFGNTGFVSDASPTDTVISGVSTENPDGTITQENTTVVQKEDATVTTTITNTHPQGNLIGHVSAEITITVTDKDGWEDAADAVEEALGTYSDVIAANGETHKKPEITVFVTGTEEIDSGFIDRFSDREVTITIIAQDGSTWRVDTTKQEQPSEEYNFAHTITAGSAELCEELGVAVCYIVRFHAPAVINAEVLMNLGSVSALQNATLFQRDKELNKIQTTVVDKQGYAHFYLGSVDDETEYYIAMNLPDAQQEALVPEELHAEYCKPEYTEPVKYEITGRTSSWGLDIKQVTWIMIGVLLGCVGVVGIVMYMLNKRRLKRGYVPTWDDDEDE